MFLLQIPNNHGAAGNTAFTFTLSGSFLWFCSRDALHLNNCMASHMLLPDPSIHTEKSAGSHMLTKTDTHICIIHTHNLSRTYMPTAVCSGRVTEPVAMTETYLFKLGPWDTTISVGLHSRTTPFSTSHTLSQTQLHWANPPPSTSTHPHKAARKLAHFLYLIQTSVFFTLVSHLPSIPVPVIHLAPGSNKGSWWSRNSPRPQILEEGYPTGTTSPLWWRSQCQLLSQSTPQCMLV